MGKVIRTAAGIASAIVAKEALAAAKDADNLGDKAALTVGGSLAASAALHLLKDDAKDVIDIIRGPQTKRLE